VFHGRSHNLKQAVPDARTEEAKKSKGK